VAAVITALTVVLSMRGEQVACL